MICNSSQQCMMNCKTCEREDLLDRSFPLSQFLTSPAEDAFRTHDKCPKLIVMISAETLHAGYRG